MVEMVGRECKFVTHLAKIAGVRPDIHVIKETLHYSDGSLKDNLKIVKNYKRPFYVTKEHYRTHKQKKESEDLEKVNVHYSTESDLGRNIATRLGSRYNGVYKLRDVIDSPYIYGVDTRSTAIIKKAYMDKYPKAISPYTLATLDIENNTITNEITIVSLVMKDKIHCIATKKYLDESDANTRDAKSRVLDLYEKYIPETDIKKEAKITFEIVENEYELVKDIFKVAHKWGPDFVAIWNIDYDIPMMVKVIEKYGGDPKDIFSDPDLPKEYRYFKYKEGMKQKITESGKFKPVNPEEQWHTTIAPAKFFLIDAMAAHRYVRVGGKSTPGGYSLNNILVQELGDRLKKLTFGGEEEEKFKGIEWHQYMTANKPLEYIVYNMWDCMSMIELDKKTKDLSTVLPMLSATSHFSIFNSGPKKIVDGMHFYYLEQNKVLGVKPSVVKADSILGLDDWIILLPSHRIKNLGLQMVEEDPNLRMNTRGHTYDSDCVSSYPSDTMCANVSKDTIARQLINIKGIEKEEFKKQNINLFFGEVNAVEYCRTMYNFMDMDTLQNYANEYLKETA